MTFWLDVDFQNKLKVPIIPKNKDFEIIVLIVPMLLTNWMNAT